MSKHLKRYFAPKTWKIKRKGVTFVTKPSPGTHKISMSMPLNVILRDVLGYANNNREVKFMLEKRNVSVDGIRRKDYRFPVGLFDVLSLNDANKYFRMVLDKRGNLTLIKIEKGESTLKLCKITGKSIVKGKTQLNLYDGNNVLVQDKGYKIGDAILVVMGKKKEVKEKVSFDKNVLIYLTGGKHISQIGKVEDIRGNRILYKIGEGNIVETLKEYAFPIGKDKPLITLAN
jgi:small subunit ribosomal protein S4e